MLLPHFGGKQPVRYWCQDETRLGLKTLTGRTITLKGVKPSGIVGWQRQNFYLYGLVEPATGESFFWEFSHLDAVCFQEFLNLFSRAYPDSLNFIRITAVFINPWLFRGQIISFPFFDRLIVLNSILLNDSGSILNRLCLGRLVIT